MPDKCHFNLALFPEDRDLIDTCICLAQENLCGVADQYLLGKDAWPHVTLCQLETETAKLAEIWHSVQPLLQEPIILQLKRLYVQFGADENTGKYWVGLIVSPEPALLVLQAAVYQKLLELGIESRTVPEKFFPHLTWARCTQAKPLVISQYPPSSLLDKRHAFKLSLGRSDEHGVYHERLYPK